MSKEIIKYQAEMLRKLVLEHKEKCDDPECGISLFVIYKNFYEPFLGKKEAQKHFKDFL